MPCSRCCSGAPCGSRVKNRASDRWNWPEARLALLMVMLYAASDEFHQSFVPNRTSQVSDVFIDTAGGAAGLLALWLFWPLAKTLEKSKMKRPLVAVVSCYAIGLLLGGIFQLPLVALFAVVPRSRPRPCPRKTPPVPHLAASRARRLDESRQPHRRRFTKRFAHDDWQ